MKVIWLWAFILIAIIQWYVPGRMIWKKEEVLKKGTAHKFEAAPVDPADPFKGRYIVLNFKESDFKLKGHITVKDPEKVYLTFATGRAGFAVVSSVSNVKPVGSDYLLASTTYVRADADSTHIFLKYPFTNYYLEESKAPMAETIYRQRAIDSAAHTYARVKIWNGDAVIENLFINDSSVHDILTQRMR